MHVIINSEWKAADAYNVVDITSIIKYSTKGLVVAKACYATVGVLHLLHSSHIETVGAQDVMMHENNTL